jgi:hypothetical protein
MSRSRKRAVIGAIAGARRQAGRAGRRFIYIYIHVYTHTHTHTHTHAHAHPHTHTHIHTDKLLRMMDTQQPLRKLIPPPGLEPGSLG